MSLQTTKVLENLPICSPNKGYTEVKDFIIKKLKLKNAPGYDLITGAIIKQLPDKAIIYLTYIFNAILHIEHFSSRWNVLPILLVQKSEKLVEEAEFYLPILTTHYI